MNVLNLQYAQAHLDGKCDFVYKPSTKKIITVGADCLIKIFDIKNTENQQEYEQDDEIHSITINPKDDTQFSFGGTSNKVEIFNNDDLKCPTLALTLLGQIIKIRFSQNGQLLGVASEENQLSIYDTVMNKSSKCRPGHSGNLLNLAFNHDQQYVCSTGCDGYIMIYQLSEFKDPIQVKAHKISKEIKILSDQVLEPSWKQQQNIVGLPGGLILSSLSLKEDNWVFESHPQIYHDKDISIVNWQSSILITYGLDLKIKVWDYETKTLIKQISCQDMVQTIHYIESEKTIAFIDQAGKLGLWKDEFKIEQFVNLGGWESSINLQPRDSQNSQTMENRKMEIETKEPQKVEIIQQQKFEIAQQDTKITGTLKPKQIQKQFSFADRIINMDPQDILYSSSTEFQSGRRYLCWNMVGCITLREENEFSFIDIEFSDHNFHRNIIMPNVNHINIATMNYMGALLGASVQIDEDEYLENDDESSLLSMVQFKHFTYQFDACDWSYKLPEGEEVQCVSVGNNWCAFSTDLLNIRVFNFGGIETMCFCIDKPIVSLDGYEDQLAYVYHDSPAFYNCQSLKMRVYNTESEKVIQEVGVPITPKYLLKWFGFSQEGLIITQDSYGIIRALTSGNTWIPIQTRTNKQKFWLIGVWDYDILGVNLNKDELEPLVFPRPQLKKLDICINLLHNDSQWWNDKEKIVKLLRQRLINQHEKLRLSLWQKYKFSRQESDPLSRYSKSIYTDQEILKKEDELEKIILELFRESLVKGDHELAIQIVIQMMNQLKSIQICILLCNKMNLDFITKKLSKILAVITQELIIFKEKQRYQEFIKVYKVEQQTTVYEKSVENVNSVPTLLLGRQKAHMLKQVYLTQQINLNPRTVVDNPQKADISEDHNSQSYKQQVKIIAIKSVTLLHRIKKKFEEPKNLFEDKAFQVGDASKKRTLNIQGNNDATKFGLSIAEKKKIKFDAINANKD